MTSRSEIINALKAFLEKEACVIAVWEGGAAATGYLDRFSDIDLSVVVDDEHVEPVFSGLEHMLEVSYGLARRYKVPEPAWHGFSQRFYQLHNTEETFYLDIALIRKSIPDKFTACDRHGKAQIWFQRQPVVNLEPTTEDAVKATGKKLYRQCVDADFVIIAEVKKAIGRGRFLDAMLFHNIFLLRHLSVMLNLRHRPHKSDFGLRYAGRDYTAEDVRLLESAYAVSSTLELSTAFRQVLSRYEELKERLAAEWG